MLVRVIIYYIVAGRYISKNFNEFKLILQLKCIIVLNILFDQTSEKLLSTWTKKNNVLESCRGIILL